MSRAVHFLALAYVCLSVVDGRQHWLQASIVKPIVKVGQQALATFLLSLSLGWAAGMMMDVVGRDALTVSLVNIVSFGIMIASAYMVGWFKSQPWRKPPNSNENASREKPEPQPEARTMPQGLPAE